MLDWFRKKKKTEDETEPPALDLVSSPTDQELKEAELTGLAPEAAPARDLSALAPEETLAAEIVSPPKLEPEFQSEAELPIDPSAGDVATAGDALSPSDENQVQGVFGRFKAKLSATKDRLAGRLESLLSSVRAIDDDLLDELEELLITSDLGTKTTNDLLFKIRGQVAKKELNDSSALKEALKKAIENMMDIPQPILPATTPLVFMIVGINGVGKTTTIAKLARHYINNGQKVLLAAGDTFRSAAVEQLGIWAERLGADIVSQPTGADASAVVFDALVAAQSRHIEVVLVDTAGRLHTKVNLMDELKKIKRVAGKALPGAPHHTILVLDGNTGQNAQRQAQTFHEEIGIDSIIMTKLDGTSKGGVIVSITNELKIPITHVGLGESFEDLEPFEPKAFTAAILGE